jgi:hypothetical protein
MHFSVEAIIKLYQTSSDNSTAQRFAFNTYARSIRVRQNEIWLPATSTVVGSLENSSPHISRDRLRCHHFYFKRPISTMIRASAVAFLALAAVENASAFSPASIKHASTTQLNAESRREALGSMGIALAGLFAGSFGAPEESVAFNNPALETFKGGKRTKGQFIPGKGMRNTEEFDQLVAFNNPALETFKGGKRTKGQFIPGKVSIDWW